MTFPRLQVRFSSSRFHLLCVFALLSWLGCQSFLPASAQTTATIEGTVSDVQGAAVPKAKVYIGGRTATGHVLLPKSLQQMLTPQFGSAGDTSAFGLGFQLGTFEGEREIGHGGAIYGFATQLSALPDSKLAVVVITDVDGANAVVTHIANDALHLMLAQRRYTVANLPPLATDVTPALARKLAGDYLSDDDRIHLDEEEGSLSLLHLNGGHLATLKSAGPDDLIEDSRIAYSTQGIHPHFDAAGEPSDIMIGSRVYRRLTPEMPKPASPQWLSLVGEYGWDYNRLYVLENEGKLAILVEWFDDEPLEPLSDGSYQLPDHGLYVGENLKFLHAADGEVSGLQLGGVTFPKRPQSAPGAVFQITPLKPVPELRKEALAAKPPVEKGDFLKPDLVELTSLDPTIKLDIRYASTRNFLGAPLYLQARAFMQRPAAEAVVRASQRLHAMGYGLLIHDAYRPWYVTKMFWDGTPDDKKIFVANPAEGSRHNRGCAVDLTLYDLKTGQPIVMTGGYDEMSERSYPFYPGGTSLQRWHRDLLRKVMDEEGFTVYEYEWWHFDYHDWRRYPILNLTFEQLDAQRRAAEN